MRNESPFISIIVPTYNRPERLRRCLAALANLSYPRDGFEVIVVDDGGADALEPVVAVVRDDLDITLLRQTNAGPAAARNRGAAHARGPFLAFTDDDCMPDPAWLQALAGRMDEASTRMLGGLTINALADNVFASASQRLIDYLYLYYNATPSGPSFFTSNNMAMRKDAFLATGGFDATFPRAAGEDREFCHRWLRMGRQMEFVRAAVIYHAHDLTGLTFLRQHFNYGRAAHSFHQRRRERGEISLTPEPIRFYFDLLRFPFQSGEASAPWRESLLLVASQIANAAGYFRERLLPPSRSRGRITPSTEYE